ncbi:N-formylglutamate amidohydrolase [Hydrocarboniphaga sp.]|uniref:N-formylglutamate amidohydrolase n=1 Tax=Hydrocarboniphaga sp. TaxID=2033016 RepID=UPI00263560F7|nr:N-formylglutamate amidohydrolase [Hydrocarboniphaga sp.]
MNGRHDPGTASLLGHSDPEPVWIENAAGRSPILLTCDHAGLQIPAALGDLGVAAADLQRHIACDIGVEGLGRLLAQKLDAVCIGQRYSRLVIDCNREPGSADSIAERSDGTVIQGNLSLAAADAEARRREIFAPYHARIAAELDARRQRGRPGCLVLLHSFTPAWAGAARPWHIGALYNRDARLARSLLHQLQHSYQAAQPDLMLGDNEPYSGTDGTDYALNHYGEARGLPYVELEIRQDLISEPAGQALWAERLAQALPAAYAQLTADADR